MLKYKINTYFNKEREFLLKKSKIFAAVLAAVMALTMFAGCNNGGSGSDASGSDDTAKTKFVLGLDDSFPPMGYRDDNDNIVGFDIDLAQAVCDEWEWNWFCSRLLGSPKRWNSITGISTVFGTVSA